MHIRNVVLCVFCVVCVGMGIHCAPPQDRGELVVLPSQDAALVEQPVAIDTAPPAPDLVVPDVGLPPVDASQEPVAPDTSAIEPPGEPDVPTNDGPAQPELSEPVPERRAPPEPAPAKKHWIGESCLTDADCDVPNGFCVKPGKEYPDGYCSAPCTGHCPDRAGKPVTFCIADGQGAGMCVQRCSSAPCRAGYACAQRSRFQQVSVQHQVCVPKQAPPTGGSRTFLYIGDSQSSGTKFGAAMVAFLRQPKSTCASATLGNNKVFSYAKVSSASRHWSQASGSSKNWLCSATKIYTNGTAASNTTGAKICAGITGISKSIFQKLIDTHQPKGFVIQLGGNSMGFAESYVKGKIRAMLDHMPTGSLCFWVTPSASSSKYLAKRRDVEKWTREALQGYTRVSCGLYTSITEMLQQTSCGSFNSGDGLHMTSCGSALWGRLITSKMCQSGRL